MSTVILRHQGSNLVVNPRLMICVLCCACAIAKIPAQNQRAVSDYLVELDQMGNGIFDFSLQDFLTVGELSIESFSEALVATRSWVQEHKDVIDPTELTDFGLPSSYVFALIVTQTESFILKLMEFYVGGKQDLE